MTRAQTHLLLYFETCAVIHAGLVVSEFMSGANFTQAHEWNEAGYIEFASLHPNKITDPTRSWPAQYRVSLSDEAWEAAHKARRKQAELTAQTS